MPSGIRSLQRINAVDLNGKPVAVMIGWTGGGRIVLGIAPHGEDRAVIAKLNADAQAQLAREVRAAIVGAAGESS
jgi:hypothetical protein